MGRAVCDGVKCMSVISMSVCLYLVNGAKRCGGGRCGAMRSGAANTERSDDDLEEERGKHQRDPKVFTNQQTCHYLDHFEAHLMRTKTRISSRLQAPPPASAVARDPRTT